MEKSLRRKYEFLDYPGPIPFAHRGGLQAGPENTWAAFEFAIGLGYRYLETDVQATSDGVALAFHDNDLGRVSDRTGLIRKLPYREVLRARVGGVESIPRLEDLLGAWPEKEIRVNIDIKHSSALRPVIRAIKRTGTLNRVCLNAFSEIRTIMARRILGPELCTGLGPVGVAVVKLTGYLPTTLHRLDSIAAATAQVPLQFHGIPVCDRRFIAVAHRLELPVHVWTINDRDTMEKLLDLGVDGIMTDDPALLKQVLLERNAWFG
jgi:glycerophosphoryl diester phosphodiesterase